MLQLFSLQLRCWEHQMEDSQTWCARSGKDLGVQTIHKVARLQVRRHWLENRISRKRPGSCEREGAFTCACSAAWHESVSFVAQAILAQGCERRFGFVAGCVHRMAPAACRPVIECGTFGCAGTCPLSVVECGYQPGQKPATCRTCGTTFPRPNVTLSNFLPGKMKEKKKNRSQTASPPVSRRSRWVSWSDSPREQTEPECSLGGLHGISPV